MTDSMVLLGVVWDPSGCRVRVRHGGGAAELVDAVGLTANYQLGPEPTRHCIGHSSPKRNGGAYVDCRNRPQPGERTCVGCAVVNAEFAADLHHAHTRHRDLIDKAMIDHLEQPNVLYVAGFRDGSLKIGTSTAHRAATRLAEQGAWQAVEVASVNDGFTVRRLEDLITDKLGLPQSVAIARKLQGMASPVGETVLVERLEATVADVHTLLGSLDRLPGGKVLPGPLSSAGDRSQDDCWWEQRTAWWSFVEHVRSDSALDGPLDDASDGLWAGLHRYPVRLDRGAHHIEILAMCGRMAVLGRPGSDDRFVADLGRLFGLELDLGRYVPDELVVQDSLF